MRTGRYLTILLGALVVAAFLILVLSTNDAAGAPANKQQVRRIICQVFGPSSCHSAVRVALCETGGPLNPRARGAAGERGLFQIHPVHFGWLNETRLYETRYNAQVAYRLSRGGRSWRPWTCKP